MKNSGDGSEDAVRMGALVLVSVTARHARLVKFEQHSGRVDSFVHAQKGVARLTQIHIRGFDGESGEVDVTKLYSNLFREAGPPQPGFVIVLFAHLAGQAHASVYPGPW